MSSVRDRLGRRGAMLLVVVLLFGAGCTTSSRGDTGAISSIGGSEGADAAVAAFAAAWQSAQPDQIAALTSDPAAATTQLTAVLSDLAPTAIAVTTGPITTPKPDTAAVSASFVWTIPKGVTWKYQTSWTFTRAGTGSSAAWPVTWSPSVIHPKLQTGQSVQVSIDSTTGGTIVDRNNQQLVVPVTVYSVVAIAAKIADLPATAAALERILKPFDATVTTASVTEGVRKAGAAGSYTVTNLREADYKTVQAQLAALTGLTFPSRVRSLPPTKDFAKVLLSQVEPLAEQLQSGTAGWTIASVDASGAVLDTLATQAGTPGDNVVLTLDTTVQKAAEAALAATPEPAVLVAIQPGTGEILAVAQNAPANAQGPIALTGNYPPGSTFKIVTATAGLDAGAVTPSTPVDCPGVITIDSREIHNEGFELGSVPLTTAFARSCNTTFAKLASQLPADALPKAAGEYGVGLDFDVKGITTLNGKVPAADSTVQKAENGFGQGVVLLTPFAAALMAATAAGGNMPMPVLVRGTTTSVNHPAPARSEAVQNGLRTMMRAVVTDGTAQQLAGDGEVYAKTGTADFTDATGAHAHAWTVGFRGNVAFAVLIVGGDDSKRTNVLADAFLQAIPG